MFKWSKQKQIFTLPTLPMFKWSNEQKQRQISPTHRRLSVQGQLGAGYTWLIRSVPEKDLVGWRKDDESRLKSIYILSKSYWGSEIICQQCFHFEIKIEQRVNLSNVHLHCQRLHKLLVVPSIFFNDCCPVFSSLNKALVYSFHRLKLKSSKSFLAEAADAMDIRSERSLLCSQKVGV